MTPAPALTLYHAPNTRSGSTLMLLEELGVDYHLEVLNLKRGDQRQPDYRAINPMGKVPAILHHGALVTEQVAIFIYLADAFPANNLAPVIGDPQRGPYLRWLAYYAACFEPAVIDRALQRDSGNPAISPYGSYERVMRTLEQLFAQNDYVLGERFSAADILWGTALEWCIGFKLIEPSDVITRYVTRITERPLRAKVKTLDAQLAAQQEIELGNTSK